MRISDWSSDVCSSDLGATIILDLDRPPDALHRRQRLAVPRDIDARVGRDIAAVPQIVLALGAARADAVARLANAAIPGLDPPRQPRPREDRKSTRLNSSH